MPEAFWCAEEYSAGPGTSCGLADAAGRRAMNVLHMCLLPSVAVVVRLYAPAMKVDLPKPPPPVPTGSTLGCRPQQRASRWDLSGGGECRQLLLSNCFSRSMVSSRSS